MWGSNAAAAERSWSTHDFITQSGESISAACTIGELVVAVVGEGCGAACKKTCDSSGGGLLRLDVLRQTKQRNAKKQTRLGTPITVGMSQDSLSTQYELHAPDTTYEQSRTQYVQPPSGRFLSSVFVFSQMS